MFDVFGKMQFRKKHELRTTDKIIPICQTVSTLFNNNPANNPVYAASYYVEVNPLPHLDCNGQFN